VTARHLSRARVIACVVVGGVLSASCGEERTTSPDLVFATPRALTVDCANPPADLEAELFVSGSRDPCPLTVDLAAGTTSGSCETTPGIVRTAVINWFVMRTSPLGATTRVVLAEAEKQVDLREEPEDDVALTYTDEDIIVRGCRDRTDDVIEGSLTQSVDGAVREVCDLDDDCANETDTACSNLGELCALADPLGA
jgi:hypothetical protein